MTTAAATMTPAATDAVWPAIRWAAARDLKLALRSRTELAVQLLFYVIVVSLFPLATSPEKNLLSTMGPGVLWVAALLASLLSLPRLFAADYADGTLEQIALSPFPLVALVFGKIAAHWLTSGLRLHSSRRARTSIRDGRRRARRDDGGARDRHADPLAPRRDRRRADAGLRAGGSLLALLVLPLCVPVLIFGAGAVDAARAGLGHRGQSSLLGAGLLLAIVAAPFAAAAAVRIALD
jgi:heme exporter protein B